MDKGEKPIKSIIREIREETKLDVPNISPFTINSYTHEEDFIVIIGYIGESKSDKVELNWEHANYKWVDKKDSLKEKLSDDAKFFIEKSK